MTKMCPQAQMAFESLIGVICIKALLTLYKGDTGVDREAIFIQGSIATQTPALSASHETLINIF